MKKYLYFVCFVLFVLMALTVHLKNPQIVELNYYYDLQYQAPLVLVISLVFIIGMVFGALLMSFSVVKNKSVVGKTKRQLAKVEKEVENLRAAPIKDELI